MVFGANTVFIVEKYALMCSV